MLGYIPVKLLAILGLGAVVTIYKMVQTLFLRRSIRSRTRSRRREEAPDFWNLTREVAYKLSTRPLDQIRITPGTETAVYESGTRRERPSDQGTRTLLIAFVSFRRCARTRQTLEIHPCGICFPIPSP